VIPVVRAHGSDVERQLAALAALLATGDGDFEDCEAEPTKAPVQVVEPAEDREGCDQAAPEARPRLRRDAMVSPIAEEQRWRSCLRMKTTPAWLMASAR
jgi:hypothetical protein